MGITSFPCFLGDLRLNGLTDEDADGRLELPFTVRDQHSLIHELMARYANVPMSFADACLVRLSELWSEAPSSLSTPTSASIAATNASRSR